jgi:hypothetical protein
MFLARMMKQLPLGKSGPAAAGARYPGAAMTDLDSEK